MTSEALWYLSRATGLVAFIVLSLVVVLGVTIARLGRVPAMPRFAGVGLHRNASMFAVVLLAIHILTAELDPFVTIGWVAAVVPFASHYEPMWLGFGALALDLGAAVVVTSLLRFRIGIRAWRAVHWLAYAIWPLAALHGIGAASDLRSGLLLDVVLATIVAVLAAVAWRFAATTGPGRSPHRAGAATGPRAVASVPAQVAGFSESSSARIR
jgi:methionine sulfoxide reductase heme-binding subunit